MLKRLNYLFPLFFPVLLVVAYVLSTQAGTAAVTSPVGEVEDVTGYGWGVSVFGKKFEKIDGDFVAHDEILGTGPKSAMKMRFVDDTTLTLGAEAEIVVDEMVYDPEDGGKDSVTLTLGKGTFYFVSGKVAKEKVTLVTPTASIGIRGTELVIEVGEDGETSVGVAKGRAIMTSRRDRGGDGRAVDIKKGHTAKTDKRGRVSDPFPGVDLTGDDDVDRNIPGVAKWHDEREELDDDTEKDDDERYLDFVGDDGYDDDDEEGDFSRDDDEDGDEDDKDDKDEGGLKRLANLFGLGDDGDDERDSDDEDKRREGGELDDEAGDFEDESESDFEDEDRRDTEVAENDGGDRDHEDRDSEDRDRNDHERDDRERDDSRDRDRDRDDEDDEDED